jgi:membrane protein
LFGVLPLDFLLAGPLAVLTSVLLWTSVPWLLLDRRMRFRRLLPAGVLTGVGAALYGVATTIYMPGLMERYSIRYGLFGVCVALVGWLLVSALILIAATVIAAEFDRAPAPWAVRMRIRFGIEADTRTADVPEPRAGPVPVQADGPPAQRVAEIPDQGFIPRG